MSVSIIICPNCKSALLREYKSMKCEYGHSFDMAKEGYINLLLSNQKKSNNPGDNKQMINARDEFLSLGHFDFLLAKIEELIGTYSNSAQGGIKTLLDLGCGSGYYTRSLLIDKSVQKAGVDISKNAVAKAAKRDKQSTYVVSSVFDLPIAADSVDVLLNVFSPIHLEEVERVLKPGGIIVKVIPSGDHMMEVAKLVYEEFIPHESSIEDELSSSQHITIVSVASLIDVVEFNAAELNQFIAMTPYLYKFTEEQLSGLEDMSVTLSFKIVVAKLA